MASSITTAVASGVITTDWCIKALQDFDAITPNQCANASLGQAPRDFSSICCDGAIVDSSGYLYDSSINYQTDKGLDLANLQCCGLHGAQAGGLMPIDTDYSHCSANISPTPLASLAATNANNAALFQVTYTSASFGAENQIGDYIPTQTPTCLWVYTKTGQAVVSVTVPAATITTLPPATTDDLGYPISAQTAGVNAEPRMSGNAEERATSVPGMTGTLSTAHIMDPIRTTGVTEEAATTTATSMVSSASQCRTSKRRLVHITGLAVLLGSAFLNLLI